MANREQLSNGATTVLTAAMDGSQTSMSVADASAFPTSGNFRVLVDSELMLVTAVSGNTFTVVRGIESTSGASHLSETAVLQIFTAGAFERVMRDNIAGFGAVTRQPFGRLTDASGNTLTSASFSVYNQNGATITDLSDGSIGVSHITNSAVMLSRTLSPPFTVRAAIVTHLNYENGAVGIGFRQSSNNRGSHVYQISPNAGTGTGPRLDKVAVLETTSPSSFNSHIVAPTGFTCARWPNPNWYEIEDNGSTMFFRFSPDGINFTQLGSKGHTYFTPNRAHFFVNPFGVGTRPLYAKLVYWSEA